MVRLIAVNDTGSDNTKNDETYSLRVPPTTYIVTANKQPTYIDAQWPGGFIVPIAITHIIMSIIE